MAYGVMSLNSGIGNINMLPSISNAYESVLSGSNQMDMLFFSDFLQVSFSTTSSSSGGFLYGSNANGGSYTVNGTADIAAVGVNSCFGVLRCATGTTNNNSGFAAIKTADGILTGIPTPTSGYITKYEWECLVETDTNIFGASRNGSLRFGMMSSTSGASPNDGVYFEFLYDGTTNDTTWNVVFRKDSSQERVDTSVTVSANKLYRLYICVEKDTSGNYTTTYKIKNVTDATNTESTAAPSNAATYYPADSGDYMGISFVCGKSGTATTNSTFVILDYMAARIRRKLNREMVILG